MTQEKLASENRIELYINELEKWSRRMNLVGSSSRDALRRHIDDSLAAAPRLPLGTEVVDLGSGAGFPGVPIALVRPDLQITLVDSRERRVHFLRHVARVLKLDCAVVRQRIEQRPERGFDFVLARAVAPLPKILALARDWVRPEGEIWIWTRDETDEPHQAISLGPRGRILQLGAAVVSRGTL